MIKFILGMACGAALVVYLQHVAVEQTNNQNNPAKTEVSRRAPIVTSLKKH